MYVTGKYYTGGYSGYNSSWYDNRRVYHSCIIGKHGGNRIGGVDGEGVADDNHLSYDNIIYAPNSDEVGGVMGRLANYHCNDWDSRTFDSTVTGKNKVGGVYGSIYYTYCIRAQSNAIVKGNSNVGGIVGYMSNYRTTKDHHKIGVKNSAVLGGEVTGKVNVGGLIGKIDKDLYYHYNTRYTRKIGRASCRERV